MNAASFGVWLKRHVFSPWGLLVLAIVAGCAYRLVQAWAINIHREPYKYELIEEFDGIRIVHGIVDPVLDAHVVMIEKEGRRERITPWTLSNYVNRKYAEKSVDEKIGHFIRLFNAYEAKIIEDVHEIPGYDPGQLDPDINPAAIKTHRFTLHPAKPTRGVVPQCVVKYAWEVVGGEIKRFRFENYPGFNNDINPGPVGIIQTQVGDHGALD